jgi:hypothetical protein
MSDNIGAPEVVMVATIVAIVAAVLYFRRRR